MNRRTINIKANPGDDGELSVRSHLSREAKTISVLSLTLGQIGEYGGYSSQQGVLAGRVIANQGFGVPNAKVSVFFPLDENEKNNLIKNLYPYKTPYDVDISGRRYNLLPSEKNTAYNKCHTPTGSFPSAQTLLDNMPYVEVYEKYYKFVTSTNDSGDYMITGIPVGQQAIHVDVDLSDIGFLSQKPIDMIANGLPEALFDSFVKFSASSDLDSLPQIHQFDTSKDIAPFWATDGQVVINRLDFKLPINITPIAYVFFGNFTDQAKHSMSRGCRPRKRAGRNCELEPGAGTVQVLRAISEDGGTEILENIRFQIDENGSAVLPIPLNLGRVVTDASGNITPSREPGIGVPTYAKIRIKASLASTSSSSRKTASYLIPNLYNDFRFGNDTLPRDFFEVRWKKIYTVANYIPRLQRNRQDGNSNFTGLKRIGDCDSNISLPFNRINGSFNIIYSIFCVIITIFARIAKTVDDIVSLVPGVEGFTFPCGGEEYEDAIEWKDQCIMPAIADFFNVIEYEFYNDFLVGSLYHFRFKFKARFKRSRDALFYRYCAFDCRDYVNVDDPSYINKCRELNVVDLQGFDTSPSYFQSGQSPHTLERGLIVEYNGEFFYAARSDVERNWDLAPPLDLTHGSTQKKLLLFATDLIELGSASECDVDGTPYLFDSLQPTTYQDNEDPNFLIDFSGFSACFNPAGISASNIYKASQAGMAIVGGEEDGLGSDFYFDFFDSDLRRHLCKTFSPFQIEGLYTESPDVIVIDEDGEELIISEGFCDSFQGGPPILSVSQYHHAFGIKGGATSLDKMGSEYFADCD
jgi:hypothetical protein